MPASLVHVARDTEIPPIVIIYLNRLSDMLFTMASIENARGLTEDSRW